MNVDVTVLDKAGRPVLNLTKDDFEVREDGVLREITNFAVIKNETPNPSPANAAPATAAPAAADALAADPERRRCVAVIIDAQQVSDIPGRAHTVDALQALLKQSPNDSQWSVAILRSGLTSMQTVLPMTSDRARITEALTAVRNGTTRRLRSVAVEPLLLPREGGMVNVRAGIEAAESMESTKSFTSAVVQVARGIAWRPGRKVIVIVSGAVPGYERPRSLGDGLPIAAAQAHELMVQEANAANASIYVIDPLGVGSDMNMGRGDYFRMERGGPSTNSARRTTSGALWLAENTGGLYLPSNDVAQSVEKLERITTNFYELAYHAEQADDKYHRITVTLKRPETYTVSYRQGYIRLSKGESFTRAMTSPLGIASQSPTLPVTLTIESSHLSPDGTGTFQVNAGVPVKLLQVLPVAQGTAARAHVYLSTFDQDGTLVRFSHFVETMSGVTASDERMLTISRSIVVPKAGKYKLFVTIRDELTDDVGIASREVTF